MFVFIHDGTPSIKTTFCETAYAIQIYFFVSGRRLYLFKVIVKRDLTLNIENFLWHLIFFRTRVTLKSLEQWKHGACSLQQLITVSRYSYCHNCFLSPFTVLYNTAKYKLAVLETSSKTLLTSPASGLLLKSTGRQELGSSSSLLTKIELLMVSFLVQVQQNYWT